MKERPIIMSTESVKAILDGRKTQTRRVIKPQPTIYTSGSNMSSLNWQRKPSETIIQVGCHSLEPIVATMLSSCPYGQVGDRLWVRETWDDGVGLLLYKADCSPRELEGMHWESPIYMPKEYSRITLEITEVRVEKLWDITKEDAKAEGLETGVTSLDALVEATGSIRANFFALWDYLNAKRGYGWETNPWVWILSFRRVG